MSLFRHGILGINKRNLNYIHEKNPDFAIRIANNKLLTKNTFSSLKVAFAKTYCIIKNTQELQHFTLEQIPNHEFVIKPNKGSKGEGILIAKKHQDGCLIGGTLWTEDDIKLHMSDILQGNFSMESSRDAVIIEEKLIPNKHFAKYCEYGLADIRLIVYNLIPIIAMLRVPTAGSGGKANIAQGGLGIGLDIANGTPNTIMSGKQVFSKHIPSEYLPYFGNSLPYWNDILLKSAEVQNISKLGYLALDWVITTQGPKLLEINAHAGLEIQNATLTPLARRLEKVEGLKITTPEKGVEVAKVLFHPTPFRLSDKEILSHDQVGRLIGKPIRVTTNPNLRTSVLTGPLGGYFESGNDTLIISADQKIILSTVKIEKGSESKITLGQDILKNYLIETRSRPQKTQKSLWNESVLTLDKEIYRINQKLPIGNFVKAVNASEELAIWKNTGGHYEPQFIYKFPAIETLEGLRKSLETANENIKNTNDLSSSLASLYEEKTQELLDRISLVEGYIHQDFSKICQYGNKIFGIFDPDLKILSEQALRSSKQKNTRPLSPWLSLETIEEHIRIYFEEHHIHNLDIQRSDRITSRMSVKYGKNPTLQIRQNAKITEDELPALLAHEIGTHFTRYTHGSETGLLLFSHGTGYYLEDEEGLAIYKSLQALEEQQEKTALYKNYLILGQIGDKSFSEAVEIVRSYFPSLNDEECFYKTLRFKRGITDTSIRNTGGALYQKDQIYVSGYNKVLQYIESGGNPHRLMYGKIKITDIPLISDL